ncbi:hypothetical protein D3C80_1338090 [compost metagenome]
MRQRGISPHAAGVRPFVAVIYRLVVLRSCHRAYCLPVNKSKYRHLLSGQELFNNHLGASLTEHLGYHDITQRQFSLLARIRNGYPFTCRQPVRLDNNRQFLSAQICKRRLIIAELLIGCCRNIVFMQQVLHKGFAAFDFSCIFTRSEYRNVLRFKSINNACRQRIIRSDNDKAYLFLLDERRQLIELKHADRHTLRQLGNPGVAGCTVDFTG